MVEVVENEGRGLNLTWEVRDGIRHHTGERKPATLEGQIVRFADRIAYINHDIDDALRAGLITPADLPPEPLSLLGGSGGDRIDVLVHDLVDTSYETGTIVQSPPIAEAMNELRDFLFQTVYPQSLERAGEQRVRHVITNLMQYFLEHPEEMGREPGAAAGRKGASGGAPAVTTAGEAAREQVGAAVPLPLPLRRPCRRPTWPAARVQAVTDYISGMTDRYAISRYRELFEPRSLGGHMSVDPPWTRQAAR